MFHNLRYYLCICDSYTLGGFVFFLSAYIYLKDLHKNGHVYTTMNALERSLYIFIAQKFTEFDKMGNHLLAIKSLYTYT